jgi:putative surface cell wall-binding protein
MKLRTSSALVLVAGALGLFAPAYALAASATVTGNVTGSTLSATTSASPSFSDNLDLGDNTPTYTVPMTLQDTRGTGAGWNLTITSTQFSTGGATPNTLATNASSLTGVTSSCASGTCTNPTNSITYPVAVPAGSTPPTAVKFFNAATSSGMGKFTITPTIGVFVPQNSFAGTYTSTLTLAVVSGP